MKGLSTLIYIVTLAAAILFGGLTACVYDKEEPEFSVTPGESLPDFSVTLLEGSGFSTAELAGSGIVNLIIVFFNTDCPDCRQDLPVIQELYDRIMADNLLSLNTRLICIAREEDAASIRAYWQANNLSIPASPQPDRRIYNLFASTGIPRLYLAQPSAGFTFKITAAYAPGQLNIFVIRNMLIY